MISVVIPVYNEEENVVLLYEKIISSVAHSGEDFEVIFVDDGSTDQTVAKLKTLPKVKILVLSMDFGQTSALDAGIHEANGDIIITMDGDLQNDPVDIPRLVAKLREGYDVVAGWRQSRHDSFGRRLLSRLANLLTAKISGLSLHDSACALKAYRGEVIKSVHLYGEMHVFLPAYLYRRGAKVVEMPVAHHARQFGVSKHYFMKAVKDIFDLLTIRFLTDTTGRPLLFFGGTGVVSLICGFIAGVLSVYLKLWGIRNFGQTPLPILTVFFILTGILFFMIGFMTELMLRIYFETNQKTPYIIKERIEKQ